MSSNSSIKPEVPSPTYWMVGAACISYGGYEFVRAATTSLLLTELGTPFVPLALICVALLSALMVIIYRRYLKTLGARSALLISANGIAVIFLLSALLLYILPPHSSQRKFTVFIIFVIRQSYVTFLSSQQFSFIVSLLELNQELLGPIYGCSSLASAIAAAGASTLGPINCILVASVSLILSSFFSNVAYNNAISNIHLAHRLQNEKRTIDKSSSLALPPRSCSSLSSFFSLPPVFKENNRLFLLFIVTFIMQMIVAMLAMCYSTFLETELLNQHSRTQFVGRFYAIANLTSAGVQFLGLRPLVKYIGLEKLMIVQPLIITLVIVIAVLHLNLWSSAAAVLTFKTIEYSLFSGVKDLTYINLGFEARFIAKEFTDVSAYRAGDLFFWVMVSLMVSLIHFLILFFHPLLNLH
jgi:hypothetical protein